MEAPSHVRRLFHGYHKIQSSNVSSSQHERNILWRMMKLISSHTKKSQTIKNLKQIFRKKKVKPRDLDQEPESIDPKIDLRENTTEIRLQIQTKLKIYVKIASKTKSMVIEAKSFHIIHDIKTRIHGAEGIEPNEYALFHGGKRLEDYRTLGSLGIKTESTLHLIFHPRTVLQITVITPTGKILSLEVNALFTVSDVKILVESLVGCPVSECTLIHDKNELEDKKSLAFYGVDDDSVLELRSPWIQIFVRVWSGEMVTLYLRRSSTVREVKEKLFCQLGTPVFRQILEFSGERLDDFQELSSYDIHKDSILHMMMSLSIKNQ